MLNTEFMKAKNLLLCITILIVSTSVMAQTYEYLDRNQIKATVNSDGMLFQNSNNTAAGFEVPKGLGVHSIYGAALWFGGKDNNGNIRLCAAQSNSQNPEQYFGPVADDYNNQNYKDKYNRVWKVDLSEIVYHVENFDKPGYVLPEAFLNWPANGDLSNGEAADLAPYYDYNSNSNYDPENGDFPLIRGDQAVYFIYNDAKGHNATGGLKTGVEVHGMLYCFNPSVGAVLTQTVFLNYRVINRSNQNYSEFYGAMSLYLELGYNNDDAFGTDSANQMMYVYNKFNEDGMYMDSNSNDACYGSPAPTQGVVMLNKEVKAALPQLYYGSGSWDINIDTAYYYMLQCKDQNGIPIYSEFEDANPTNFLYNGYPETGEGWVPDISSNSGYWFYNKALISAGPYSLKSGESLCFDIAFPFAKDYNGSNLSAISLLREKAAGIIEFYDEYGFDCDNNILDVAKIVENDISIYPNPSAGNINLSFSQEFTGSAVITLYSIDGKPMREFVTANQENILNISEPGLYLVVVKLKDKIITKRISVI